MASNNALFSVIWLLLLIFVAFWIAFFVSWFYIIIFPVTACVPDLAVVTDFLLKIMQFPHYCVQAMMEGRPLF